MSRAVLAEQLSLLPDYLGGHLVLTLSALILGILLAIPLALVVTRARALQWPTLTIVGILQTIPGIALLALMVPLLGMIGFIPALVALFLYSLLPIVRNTVTGILTVDPALTEAARGIGMTSRQSLFKVELPLALPTIVAGIRTAAVWVVGTATLSTPVGATSLGNYIFSGLQTQNFTAVSVGCIAAAVLATILDAIIRLVEVALERQSRARGALALILLLLVFGGGLTPYLLRAAADDERPVVTIGAKTFTEQYILADLIAARFARAGFATDVRGGLGSTVLFDALAAGEIDCYIDYSGTIWANAMKRTDILDADTVLRQMTDWLATEHGIVCVGPLGFENTYALATTRAFAEEHRLADIRDLAPWTPTLTMGSDYEFYSRPEWESLRDSYRLRFADLLSFDASLMYQSVAAGQVDVISAFSTDGRIADFNLTVLDDPLNALPPYDAVILLSPQAARRPDIAAIARALVHAIDDDMMRRGNLLVDLKKLTIDNAVDSLESWIRKH